MKSRLLETACFLLFFASCHHKSLGLGELAPKSNIKLHLYLLLRFVIETSLPRDLKNLAGPWFLLVNSRSGDIDKPVILVAGEFDTRILIGNGTGKYRKISDVSACKLSGKQKKHCLGCTPLLAMTMFRAFFQRKATLLKARQREFSISWLIRYFSKWSMYNFRPAGLIGRFCVYDFWMKAAYSERGKERNIWGEIGKG